MYILIKCDNTSAFKLIKNPIQNSKTKHIVIKYYFIRDHAQKGDIVLEFVSTDLQLLDIFTKPLNEKRLCFIQHEIGMSNTLD